MEKKSNKKGFFSTALILVLLISIVFSCSGCGMDNYATEYTTEDVMILADDLLYETKSEEEEEAATQKATTTKKEKTTKKITTTKKPTTTSKPTTTKKPTTTEKLTTTKKVTTTKMVTTTKKKIETTKLTDDKAEVRLYILNTNTHKFHYPGCGSVKKIKPENYSEFEGTRDSVIAKGYDPCGNCHP